MTIEIKNKIRSRFELGFPVLDLTLDEFIKYKTDYTTFLKNDINEYPEEYHLFIIGIVCNQIRVLNEIIYSIETNSKD